MRLEQFQSVGNKPFGEGDERKVFVDPKREGRVIVENKDQAEYETTLQLKGRYYLTKIVHHLLPDEIPDIHQVGEAKAKDGGKQTIDRERVTHSTGQEALQQARHEGKDEEEARQELIAEMGEEMGDLDMKLSKLGLGFNIDSNVGNYTRNASGKVNYLESFKPWQTDVVDPKELEVLFDEAALREAIDNIPDEKTKNECLSYLDRLLDLLEEERKGLQEQKEPERPDCRERVEAFETKYAPYFSEETLAHLNAITSVSEALADIKRKSVKIVLGEILTELQAMKSETNIADEEYKQLYAKRNALMRAFGTLRNGVIDRSEPK